MKRSDDEKFAIAMVGVWLLWVQCALAVNIGIIYIVLHFVFKYW